MSCPTCDHTMQAAVTAAVPPAIGAVIFYWCPRCGTTDDLSGVHVPKLVERCREFEAVLDKDTWEGEGDPPWVRLGIHEAIHKPEDREVDECPICGGTVFALPLPGTVGLRCVKCCHVPPEEYLN